MLTTQTVRSAISIRDLETVAEIRAVERLQKEVWEMEDREIIPLTQLVGVKAVGGVLIGAFDNDTLVGFVYGFMGRDGEHWVLHSQKLAVKQVYRGLDLGYRLKLAQRDRALARGIKLITWTFDPLQSLNAYFNLGKLGALAGRYEINFYGEETSSFLHRNIGGTDRLWVSWPLPSKRVRRRLETKVEKSAIFSAFKSAVPLVGLGSDGSPERCTLIEDLNQGPITIEIPTDIASVQKKSSALTQEWRETTRWAFTQTLVSGYLVEEFHRFTRKGQQCGAYLLTSRKKVEDFLDKPLQ